MAFVILLLVLCMQQIVGQNVVSTLLTQCSSCSMKGQNVTCSNVAEMVLLNQATCEEVLAGCSCCNFCEQDQTKLEAIYVEYTTCTSAGGLYSMSLLFGLLACLSESWWMQANAAYFATMLFHRLQLLRRVSLCKRTCCRQWLLGQAQGYGDGYLPFVFLWHVR